MRADAISRISAFAHSIDPERARLLSHDFAAPEHALALLLGTAFPALTPAAGHQLAALSALQREGVAAQRRQRDLRKAAEEAVAAATTTLEFEQALRQFVWREKARVALRELLPLELGGAPIAVTARELGLLASEALELSLSRAQAELAA